MFSAGIFSNDAIFGLAPNAVLFILYLLNLFKIFDNNRN